MPATGGGVEIHSKISGRPPTSWKRDALRPNSAKPQRPSSALSVTWSSRQSGATTPHRPISAASLHSRPGSAFSVASGKRTLHFRECRSDAKLWTSSTESFHRSISLRRFTWSVFSGSLTLVVTPGLSSSDMKDGDAQQVAKISGQLWLGQLLSLMTSINKWPLSLSPKSLSRSICAKACSLLQAEAAALFLVNHHAEEVILQAQYPSRPKNQRPASAATGQSAETRTNDAGNDAV